MAETFPGEADFLTRAAGDLFGLSYLFPYQRLVITNILEAARDAGIGVRQPGKEEDPSRAENFGEGGVLADGRESSGRRIVILPTGAGKSLCFLLPALLMDGATLVIYPLLGLMADQERRLAERGFTPLILRGGQSGEEREAVWKKIRGGGSNIVIANPEVLLSPAVLAALKSCGFVHIVIDEAHCVSEWGESFRPAYLEIARIIDAANPPLVTAFTATAGTSVLEKIEKTIFREGAQKIVGNPDRKNIAYAAKGCILRDLAVRDILLEKKRPAVVFCSSRPGTEKLALYLRSEAGERNLSWRKDIRFYHAGLSREEKEETGSWFLRNRNAVLAATCAFGLGIDKSDIRTVIHRDCPPSVEAYLQESGRAGRDGLESEALLLWGPGDEGSLARARGEDAKRRVSALLSYARDTTRCRREALMRLLDYGGERDSPASYCCDVCAGEARPGLREEAALAGFFRRNGRSYTRRDAAEILARAENLGWSKEDAGKALNYLVSAGKLAEAGNLFRKGTLRLSRQSCAGRARM